MELANFVMDPTYLLQNMIFQMHFWPILSHICGMILKSHERCETQSPRLFLYSFCLP